MRTRKHWAKAFVLILLIAMCLCLAGCASEDNVCYYGYFENQAYVFIYAKGSNTLYGIRLPLEQILLWGKQSGLDSIPIAMRNFVGMKEQGFLIGSADNLLTLSDMLDAMGSESDAKPSNAKRLETLAQKAALLSKRPLSDKINQLCGQDSAGLLKLLAEKNPATCAYDAHNFFDTDDLNFSQRYFTQWLGQVLGGTK